MTGDTDNKGTKKEIPKRSISPKVDKDELLKEVDLELNSTMEDFNDYNEDVKKVVRIALRGKIYEKISNEIKYKAVQIKYEAVRDERRDLKNQVENASYLKYCETIRNKIASFDEYVYHPGMPTFKIQESDLALFRDYNSRNQEKRRLRWLFLLENYIPDIHHDVRLLKDTYSAAGLTDEYFAMCISKAYSKLSSIIKSLCQNITDHGTRCDHLTDDPWINYSIVLFDKLIDFQVGKMTTLDDRSTNTRNQE